MIGDVIDIHLAYGFGIALLASMMTAYAGFGGALVMVPLFTFLFGPVQAIGLMGICGMIGQGHLVASQTRYVRWSEAAPVCLAMLVAIGLGTHFLVSANPKTIRIGIGMFVLISAAVLMSNIRYRGPRGPVPSVMVGLVTGGIMGGFGVPAGPVLVVYYLAGSDSPPVQRANILISAYLMIVLALAGLALRNAIETETLLRAVFIAPGSILGAILGRILFRIAPAAWFRPVAYGLLIAIGISAIVV